MKTTNVNCFFGMFRGCVNLTEPPHLFVRSLATTAAVNMFNGCTSPAALPEITALSFSKQANTAMFGGCTGIRLSETQTDEYTQPYRIPAEGTGRFLQGSAFANMFDGTGGTFTGTPELNTTYYLHKDCRIV